MNRGWLSTDEGSSNGLWHDGPVPLPWDEEVTDTDVRCTYLAFRPEQAG